MALFVGERGQQRPAAARLHGGKELIMDTAELIVTLGASP